MKQLDSKYDFSKVEAGKYDTWVSEERFKAEGKNSSKDPFSIMIPPPNVTGVLHLGHAWDGTIQDILVRYKRMNNFDTLYLPGMDHAGIATQAVVDARLKEEGISRYDIGREKFVERAFEWKDDYAKRINSQWKSLGLSLDYSRERFTLDEGFNNSVNTLFIKLYNDGLLYRGERIINWDVQAKTALSNIEVEYKDVAGSMYTFKYFFEDSEDFLEVSTTRPETMFGDVCIVVNPDDKRYVDVIGKSVINPANGDLLPIIADDYVDVEFGTGAMKCTPAHDPNDFEIGERHNLELVNCMNDDGTMNELANQFVGLDRFEARKQLVEYIKENNALVSIKEHIHQVGHSERTGVIVEPYLSMQWFVKMKPLAEEVLKYQNDKDKKINFYPERFENVLFNWLENIEDWCISRQIWWGHKIPAWYHNETSEIYVGENPPADLENYTQDTDVLDTWFSSSLWPFATLGWPEDTEDLERYFPNDTLVTGYDIIFFWVARMAFTSRYLMDSRPFKDVVIHGLIRDSEGRKMSKSLGNGVDPKDVIADYGIDALRFFLATNSTPGQDVRYIESKVEAAWNFINKLWNASRFVIMNLEDLEITKPEDDDLSLADFWIIDKYNQTLDSVNKNMDKYEYA
ncbi:MAG TPA: valine--tRNA ligase, partial [Erysipelotrichaceae bacterium]|nr:valine--tRNA ligase [Erysipelotrichaceae bacterium]